MVRRVLMLFLGAVSLIFAFVLFALFILSTDLPSVEKLKDWRPPEATLIYDYRGRVFGDVAVQRRYYVPLKDIPLYVREAFIAAEV